MTAAQRWRHRPDGSNWGDFGTDDQVGRLNLITPERRAAAAREVREGIAFVLSLPLDLPGKGIQPPFRRAPRLAETAGHNRCFAELFGVEGIVDVGCDDEVTLNTQYSTQWDALSHVGALFDADGDGVAEKVYYNGFLAGEDIVAGAHAHAEALGIERQAETGIQGRGVLIDLHVAFGDEKVAVTRDQLVRIMADQRVAIAEGDILCLHTGFASAVLRGGAELDASAVRGRFATLDGHDAALLQWITDSGIAAIAADNIGVEGQDASKVRPGEPLLPLHHHCLFKLGLPLGELWNLGDLAAWLGAAGRTRFLLTAPPLRLPGAVGSPVTPVATV